jgi:hypothetical protein
MVFADLRSPVLWLGKDDVAELGPDDPVAGLYKKYNDTQGDLFELWMGSRQADSESSSFAGAESCKSCHADAYKVWANSKHAHAFATLEGKSKDQDLECISCHVVGFDSKDGFPATGKGDWKDSQLKNVQCENCHGPRKDHVANPTIKSAAPDAKAVCVSCHHTPHSTDFNFDERWKKIAHGHSK